MAPDLAPFMADECLLSMPEVEGIDYTMKEYMKLVEKTNKCVERLNAQGGDWNPHKVELAVWAYYILREHRPELLEDLPDARPAKSDNYEPKQIVKEDRVNGENGFSGEVSRERGAEQNGKTNGVVRTNGDTDEERQASSNGEVGSQ